MSLSNKALLAEIARRLKSDTVAPTLPPLRFPAPRAVSYIPVDNDARPAYLSELTSSTFGTKVRRISNVSYLRNRYVGNTVWNADGSRLILDPISNNPLHLLDGTTYADLTTLAKPNIFIWSNTDPDKGWGTFGSEWKQYSVASNTWKTRRDFGVAHGAINGGLAQPNPYTYVNIGGTGFNAVEVDPHGSRPSLDDHRIVMRGHKGGSPGTWDIIVYDPLNDAIVALYDWGAVIPAGDITPSGERVVMSSRDGSVRRASWVICGNSFHFERNLNNMSGGALTDEHAGQGRLANGNDCHIVTGGYGFVINLVTGEQWQFLPNASALSQGHEDVATGRPGYVYLSSSIYYDQYAQGFDWVAAVPLDGSAATGGAVYEVYSFAHDIKKAYSSIPGPYGLEDYYGDPFASPNRTGDKVIFGSNWQGVPDGNVYAYVAGIAT